MDFTRELEEYRRHEIEIYEKLDLESVNELMNVLETARLQHHRIFIMGNGGSASTATHYVCDFMKGVSLKQDVKYDFECLNDNKALLLAIANDIGYDKIFEIPLQAKLHPGDVVIGISGSGNSMNVVNALTYANAHGGITVGITGYDGGRILNLAQHNVHVDADNMQIVEDLHMVLDHMMMYVLASQN